MSINRQMEKQSAVYPFNGLLETEKIEQINETPQKEYTKWKKPNMKKLDSSIYMTFWKRQNHWNIKQISPRLEEVGEYWVATGSFFS